MKVAAFLAVVFATIAWPAAARADDAARFSGFSAGVLAGAARGKANYRTDPNCPPQPVNAVFCNAAPDPSAPNGTAVASSGTGKMVPDGLSGGLYAGYNWQKGRVVHGIEADLAALDVDETASTGGVFPFAFAGTQYGLTTRTSLDWMSTLRARIGMTVTPQVLLYATGGAAFTRIKLASGYSDNAIGPGLPGGTGSAASESSKAGWVIGGGAQWALNDRWSAKAEYLYADFGSVSVAVPVTNTPAFAQTISATSKVTLQVLRFGFDYRF